MLLASGLQPLASGLWLTIIALDFTYAVPGVVLMFIAYRVIDKMTPDVTFPRSCGEGTFAAGVYGARII